MEVDILGDIITAEISGDEITVNVVRTAPATYDSLLDTPNTKVGQAGKFPQVNGLETLHEYVKIQDIEELTDGATITWDWEKLRTRYAWLSTGNSRNVDLQNVPIPTDTIFQGAVGDIIVKKTTAGDITLTLQGTGLYFYDIIEKTGGATLGVVLSGANGDYFEISCEVVGFDQAGDYIVFVTYE